MKPDCFYSHEVEQLNKIISQISMENNLLKREINEVVKEKKILEEENYVLKKRLNSEIGDKHKLDLVDELFNVIEEIIKIRK